MKVRQNVARWGCLLLSLKFVLCICETGSKPQQGSSRGSETAIICTLLSPMLQLGRAMLLASMTEAVGQAMLQLYRSDNLCRAARWGRQVDVCADAF